MTKTFKVPFATQGDRTSIPNEVQADGAVSYTQGYGYDYERDQVSDPAAKDIEREKMNGIFHDITEAIGEVQNYGFPKWTEEGKPYPIRAVVYHKNKVWQSKVENNEVEPVDGTQWAELKADLTASDINVYNKTESDKRFQPLGNYLVAGYSYSKQESDTNYQPKGNYAPAGNYAMKGDSYTKEEGDGRYQPKGNYAPAGDYATNDTVNSKFNAANSAATNANTNANSRVPSTRKVNGKPLSTDITLNADDVGSVPSGRTVNGKPLTSNITLISTDVMNSQSLGLENLNNLITPGVYGQHADSNTSGDRNYPQNNAGTLVIYRSGANSVGITQLYFVYDNSRVYRRSLTNPGVWTPWISFYDENNKPTPGVIGAYTKAEVDEKVKSAGITAVRLGSEVSLGKTGAFSLGNGEVVTGLTFWETGSNSSVNFGGYRKRAIQYNLNGTWVNAASV